MNSTTPLVTIAIPTYNRLDYLKQAVLSAQQQTYLNLEILVSDNASVDGTKAWMQNLTDHRIRYLRHDKNLGMVGNWNTCLHLAQGAYFLLLSDDDLLEPNAITTLIETYQQNPQAAFVYGAVSPLVEDPTVETAQQIIENFFLRGRPTFACSILYRRGESMQPQNYDNKFKLLFDAAFWMQYLKDSNSTVAFTQLNIGQYRVHASNESTVQSVDTWRDETLLLLEDYLKTASTPSYGFVNSTKFHAHARAMSSYPIPKLTRMGRVIGLGWNYRTQFILFLRMLLRCLR
jgi:glycosyltransferase involved in cell wall biosynthesis